MFCISLLAPFVYWRGLYFAHRRWFDKPLLRTKTGLQIHHLHYGILLILVASVLLLLFGPTDMVTLFLGIGLGLMLDEFVASLLMPGNRPVEMDVYRRSFKATAVSFGLLVSIILLLSLVFIPR